MTETKLLQLHATNFNLNHFNNLLPNFEKRKNILSWKVEKKTKIVNSIIT